MRTLRIAPLLAVLALALPSAAAAQQTPGFAERRAELTRALQQTQDQLNELRTQRLRLQARVENALAASMQQRAQQLMMSNEATALAELDAMLVTAQDNLLAQRDRVVALGESIRRRTGAEITIILRADSSAAQVIGNAELQVNGVAVATRAYTPAAVTALELGAVDELYRSEVLPTSYTIRLQVRVNDQPLTQSLTVNVQPQMITFVQFAVRNGQIIPSSYTSAPAAP